MTAIEYLRILKDLAASFAHAEPVPKPNKSPRDLLEEQLSPEFHEILVKGSIELRQQLHAEAYGAETVDRVHEGDYHWMQILNGLMDKLKQLYLDTKVQPPVFPCVGVLPIGTLDAVAIRVPESEEHLIIFNEGVFLFIYILAKIATVTASSPGTKGTNGRWDVEMPDECKYRFRDLFLNYILHGKPNRAEQWLLEPRFLIPLQNVTTAAELFLLAHEMKHITADDLTNKVPFPGFEFLGEKLQPLMTARMQERLADAEAAAITMGALSKEMNIFIAYNGIELAICAHQLVENALKLFDREEIAPLSIFNNERSFEVNRAITRWLGADSSIVTQSGTLTRTIIQELWDGIVPRLLVLREQGCRPATVWSPAM